MQRTLLLAFFAASTLAVSGVAAQRGPRPGVTEGDFVMKNFRFTNGATLP
jgi:hypothetical protein